MPHYFITVLTSEHVRALFSCGEPTLDIYLKQRAWQDITRNLAQCYVLTEQDHKQVLGYYTLSATVVDLRALPEDMQRRSGRYPVIPAVLLGRLAVDQQLRGGGYGALLLADAMQRAMQTGIGVKLVVVNALHETALQFYEHHGFRRFNDSAMRLYITLETLRQFYPAAQNPDSSANDGPQRRAVPPEGSPS